MSLLLSDCACGHLNADNHALQQVPIVTINIHLGSRDCLQVCPSSRQRCKKDITAQKQGVHQTAAPPAVLQSQRTSSETFAGSSGRVADAVQRAAVHVTHGKPLLDSDCKSSAVVAEAGWRPTSSEPVIRVHEAPPASSDNHQPSAILQASTSETKHLALDPHAELVGEYRIPDFVTAQEEVDIVRTLDTITPQWRDSTFNGKHRYHQPKHKSVKNLTPCSPLVASG